MYDINDTIIFGSQKVCKITNIIEKNINGNKEEFYILKPVFNDSAVIFVPKNETMNANMRRVLPVNELYKLIKSITTNNNYVWIEDESERNEKNKKIIADKDRSELIKLIIAIYNLKQKQKTKDKKISENDKNYYKKAQKIICEEFAFVLNIEHEDVIPFIINQIKIEGNM